MADETEKDTPGAPPASAPTSPLGGRSLGLPPGLAGRPFPRLPQLGKRAGAGSAPSDPPAPEVSPAASLPAVDEPPPKASTGQVSAAEPPAPAAAKPTSAAKPAPAAEPAPTAEASPPPLIIDLGRQKSGRVKRLRGGAGPLMADVGRAIDDLRAEGLIADGTRPVIIVIERKRRRDRWMF